MEPITSIAEIPFREKEPLALLHLDQYREHVDTEFEGYGYGRLSSLSLIRRADGTRYRAVQDALVLALHAADDGEAFEDDIELEFFLHEVVEDYSVTALLSTFLAKRLPAISSDERALVLAICNPHRATIPKPPTDVPVYYALGDVDSYLEEDGSGMLTISLVADEWRVA